jgi:glycerophosphoryl diester phosphodiesterase
VVSESTPTIRRFHEASCGLVARASSSAELISFYLLSRFGLGRLASPRYQALQGPETYYGLHVVTPGFVRVAHEQGLRVDVWTLDTEPDLRRLLGYGVDGIITDRPDILTKVLEGSETDDAAHSEDTS